MTTEQAPAWAYWSWPMRGYTPVMAYIMFHWVNYYSWSQSIQEGVAMWWAYVGYDRRYAKDQHQ